MVVMMMMAILCNNVNSSSPWLAIMIQRSAESLNMISRPHEDLSFRGRTSWRLVVGDLDDLIRVGDEIDAAWSRTCSVESRGRPACCLYPYLYGVLTSAEACYVSGVGPTQTLPTSTVALSTLG